MNTLFIQDINVNSDLNTSTYGFHNVNEMDTPIAENVLTILLLFCTCKYTCFVENFVLQKMYLSVNVLTSLLYCFEYKYINCLSLM